MGDSTRNRQDLEVFQLRPTPQAPERARGREIRFSALDPSGARRRGDGGRAPVPKFWVITPSGDCSVYRALDPAFGWLRGPGADVQCGTWPRGRIPGGSRESSGFDFTRNRPDLDICQLRPPPRALKGVRGRGPDLDVCHLRPTPQALERARGREIMLIVLDPSGARLRGGWGCAPALELVVASPRRYFSEFRSLDPALGWLRGPGMEFKCGNWPLGRIPGGSRESSGFDCTRNRPDLDVCQLRPPPQALKRARGRGPDLDVCQLRPTPQALERARGCESVLIVPDPSGARLRGGWGWSPALELIVASPQSYFSEFRSLDPASGWLRGPGLVGKGGIWPVGRIPGGGRESSGCDRTSSGSDLDVCQLRPPPRALKGARGRGPDLDVCQLRSAPQALGRARGREFILTDLDKSGARLRGGWGRSPALDLRVACLQGYP